nr:calcium-binding protein [Reinekea sp. G2M2-21]
MGQDTVNQYESSSSAVDQVLFVDIAVNEVTFLKSGNDLIIKLTSTTDQMLFKSWFSSVNYQVDEFVFADGTSTPADTFQQNPVLTEPN